MIYYLFEYLKKIYHFPGMHIMHYISFRSGISLILSLFIVLFYGKKIIIWLRKKQIIESIRDLGLDGQKEKEGTPTMGGIIIIIATIIPTILFSKVKNLYIIMMIITVLWTGIIGFIDDYIKIFYKNKNGLKSYFKIIGQILLGIFIGYSIYFHSETNIQDNRFNKNSYILIKNKFKKFYIKKHIIKTTVPFLKNNEFNYSKPLEWINPNLTKYSWIIFIPTVILIIISISNGSNLTDGIDGLASGTSVIIVSTLALLAWFSGNCIISNYLNIMYIPEIGEMVIFSSSFVGALLGFIWYSTYPAQIFMGDTGSLTIGSVIAVLAIFIRKELMLPLLCGIFFIENLSVIIQIIYFKYTKQKTGKGKKIFLMSPLHHHFQKQGYHESKIVNRFLIVQILLSVIVIVSLKIR